ncbi:MAG: hypothetical protein FPO08_07780 [Geobacter sp.]|nr:MAG: hypothetical protein FPO08_07780 [Geobacter sp.]
MRNLTFFVAAVAIIMLNGCANSSKLVRASSSSTRSDIFKQVPNGDVVPSGYADLLISSSLKTHKPGMFSSNDLHGTSDYKLMVNIDGQSIQLQTTPHMEDFGSNSLRDTEVGEGARYRFITKLRLRSGAHKVVLALPAEDLALERQITLTEGSSNSLILQPVYRQSPGKIRPGYYGVTSYKEGIKGIRLLLNDKPL